MTPFLESLGTEITAAVEQGNSEAYTNLPVGVWVGTLLPPLGPPPDRANSDIMMLSKLADGMQPYTRPPRYVDDALESHQLNISDSFHSSPSLSPTGSAHNVWLVHGNNSHGDEYLGKPSKPEGRPSLSLDGEEVMSSDSFHGLEFLQRQPDCHQEQAVPSSSAQQASNKRWSWQTRSLSMRDQNTPKESNQSLSKSWSFRRSTKAGPAGVDAPAEQAQQPPSTVTIKSSWGWARKAAAKSASQPENSNRSDTSRDYMTVGGEGWDGPMVAAVAVNSGDSDSASSSGLRLYSTEGTALGRLRGIGWATAFTKRAGRGLQS